MVSEFPSKYSTVLKQRNIETLKSVINGIRNIRSEMLISPKTSIKIIVEKNSKLKKLLDENKNYLFSLSKVNEIDGSNIKIPPSAIFIIEGTKLHIPLEGLIDVEAEIERNLKNLEKHNKSFFTLSNQLENKKFLSNAPRSLIKERKNNFKEVKLKISTLEKQIKILKKIK